MSPARAAKAAGSATSTKAPVPAAAGPDPAKAIQLVAETLEAMAEERGADEAIWGSMIKEAIKRRHPGFNERAHGFKSFNALLLAAQEKKRILLEPHEKSGGYRVKPVEPDPF